MATLNWLLGREGLAPLPVENAGSLVGAGVRVLIKRGFAASDRTVDPQKLEVLFGDFLARYNAHIADRTQLYPGVETALAAFAREGWRQAVCTNKIESSAKLLMDRLGVRTALRLHLRPDTFGVSKPDPTPLHQNDRRFRRREGTRDHRRGFGRRHQNRSRGRPPRDCRGLWLYRRPRRGARARPGDLALRRAHGGLRGAVGSLA